MRLSGKKRADSGSDLGEIKVKTGKEADKLSPYYLGRCGVPMLDTFKLCQSLKRRVRGLSILTALLQYMLAEK